MLTLAFVAGFLSGAVWVWLDARRLRRERDAERALAEWRGELLNLRPRDNGGRLCECGEDDGTA